MHSGISTRCQLPLAEIYGFQWLKGSEMHYVSQETLILEKKLLQQPYLHQEQKGDCRSLIDRLA